MSLNKMQLPVSVIAGLFKHALVLSDKKNTEIEDRTGTKPAFNFLGNNLKNISLIVNSTRPFFLEDQYLVFFTKMLDACKLGINDVAIINHNINPVNVVELNEELNPKIVLLFGLEPTAIKLPFNSPAFKIQEYNNRQYLYVPSLEELSKDTEESKVLKSKLWVCLRKLFEI
ncbi:MAG: hypothetical protein JST75_10295 [Bacteroidetes bacterium]|nr:hypothetical protein [Bacteroidota bacterium]